MGNEQVDFENERRHVEGLVASILGPLVALKFDDIDKAEGVERQAIIQNLVRIASQTAISIRERL